MALEMNDLMALQSLDKNQMTPYEQYKIGHLQSKRASGTAIAGLTVAVGAAVLAIGAGAWAGSRAQNAKEIAIAKNDGLKDLVATLATTVAAERQERIAGDINLTNTVNDTQSGSQQGTIASQIENSAIAQATAQVMTGLMTGEYGMNSKKVQLMSPETPFQCGCGCNG